MKRLFIIAALCLVCVASFGQERVNRPKLSFISEGPVLTKFTGWSYNNSSGEWIEHENLICGDSYAFDASHYKNNIISLQFKTIKYKDTPYYILIWYKKDGAYRYEHIHEDWMAWKTYNYLMFDEINMGYLRDLTNNPISISVPTASKLEIQSTSDVDVIQTEMERKYHLNTTIIIYKATDGSIRFMFENILDKDISKKYFEISEEDYLKLIDVHF